MQRRSYSDSHIAPRRGERNGRLPTRPQKVGDGSTHCESSYLHSVMHEGCELVFVLQKDEVITGMLAWYDEGCLKVLPTNGSPSLVIPKRSLKYLYELREAAPATGSVSDTEGANGTNSII